MLHLSCNLLELKAAIQSPTFLVFLIPGLHVAKVNVP